MFVGYMAGDERGTPPGVDDSYLSSTPSKGESGRAWEKSLFGGRFETYFDRKHQLPDKQAGAIQRVRNHRASVIDFVWMGKILDLRTYILFEVEHPLWKKILTDRSCRFRVSREDIGRRGYGPSPFPHLNGEPPNAFERRLLGGRCEQHGRVHGRLEQKADFRGHKPRAFGDNGNGQRSRPSSADEVWPRADLGVGRFLYDGWAWRHGGQLGGIYERVQQTVSSPNPGSPRLQDSARSGGERAEHEKRR